MAVRIDKESLLRIHRQNAAAYNQQHATQVIDALGGINNVISMILSSTDIQLDEEQLITLHQIINSKTNICQIDAINMENKNGHIHPEWSYDFKRNNTYLQHI